MTALVDRLWYGRQRPLSVLWPLAWLYRAVARRRELKGRCYAAANPLPVPVVVVGNITAGGTGKSPLTAWLVSWLREQGWRPVILTRGYGGQSASYPVVAKPDSNPAECGDEPVMLAIQTDVPVVVDPDRHAGARWAIAEGLGDVLVCDDGLQHYRLPRDIELAVIDGARGFGNGAPIPVGPMREPPERLGTVDFVITNGDAVEVVAHPARYIMTLEPATLTNLRSGESRGLELLQGQRVRAVAGIGNPVRFFDTLTQLGAEVRGRALPDHHEFTAGDLDAGDDEWLVVTAKDAVKCRKLLAEGGSGPDPWVLEVRARLPAEFATALLAKLNAVRATGT